MYLRYIVLTLAMSLVNSVFPGYSEGHDNDESSLYAKTKDPLGAIFAPLRTVVNDDVNDSRVQVSVCKNAIFTNCPIATGKNVHLNETVACLLQTLDYLDEEGTCAMVFSSIINNVLEACKSTKPEDICFNLIDIPDRIYYLEPLDDITCFAQNYFTRTDACRSELDELIGNIIPCADEARKYCPGDVAGTMPCLNATYSNSSGIFSTGCIGLISTWSYTTNLESLETEGDISDDYDTRDFIYFEDSTQWSRVLKAGLGATLFCVFMIIYCIKRFCGSNDTSRGSPDDETYGKSSRGMYIRAATGPDDWEVEDEEEDDWRPTEI